MNQPYIDFHVLCILFLLYNSGVIMDAALLTKQIYLRAHERRRSRLPAPPPRTVDLRLAELRAQSDADIVLNSAESLRSRLSGENR